MPLNPNASAFAPSWSAPSEPSPPPNDNSPACRLSEQAQDLVLDFVRETSSVLVAERTFAAICITSRHWLEAGQRALYRAPLAARRATWPRAHALLNTLRSRLGLAAQVKDLRMLGRRVAELGYLSKQAEPSFNRKKRPSRKQPKAENLELRGSRSAWALEVIRSCPLSKVVGIALGTALKVQDVLDSMARSVEHIEVVRVGRLSHVTAYEEVNQLVTSRPFKSVGFSNFDNAQSVEQEDSIQFVMPENVRVVPTIDDVLLHNSLQDALLRWSIFKQPAIHVKNLRVNTKSISDEITGIGIIRRVLEGQAAHLETLQIESTSPEHKRKVYIQTYDMDLKGFIDCSELGGVRWHLFSRLTHVALHGFQGFDSKMIEKMVGQLAVLTSLSLQDSTWTDVEDFDEMYHGRFRTLTLHIETLHRQTPTLKRYDLGVMPLTSGDLIYEALDELGTSLDMLITCQLAKQGGFRGGRALHDSDYMELIIRQLEAEAFSDDLWESDLDDDLTLFYDY
ncbi:hypothetical protein OIV83_004980 [Microbotryomycetes sp. JL201]|nr:hypothetical protein OIV83_004980 [Microbotryomycetes sp. JL201]